MTARHAPGCDCPDAPGCTLDPDPPEDLELLPGRGPTAPVPRSVAVHYLDALRARLDLYRYRDGVTVRPDVET